MKRVFVGLSGGVDSAVSAALLQERGYDVTGVFIKIWQPEFLECTWKEDRLDAMRVCAALRIPFREIDLSDEYKKHVVQKMISDYAKGITPNPDVSCNRFIKFGPFREWAIEQGAEKIATGHYARIEEELGHYRLLRAKDATKDQSYFLCRLGQPDLARSIFPIGDLEKTQVRKEAERFGLPVAKKPDSQGLCFVGDVSMRDFLGRFIKLEKGKILDVSGTTIGEHDGAALFTIGQRHGFSISGAHDPMYVIAIDANANTITVSVRRDDAARAFMRLTEDSWVEALPRLPLKVDIQTRYREKPVQATISREAGDLVATFATPHIASPGQIAVFYDGDVCLGGATIL